MDAPKCEECERLWKLYAETIRTHVRLEYKLKGIALEGDLNAIRDFASEVDGADDARESYRAAIRLHQAKAHESRANSPQ